MDDSLTNGNIVVDIPTANDEDDDDDGDDEENGALGIRTQEYNLRVISPKTRYAKGQKYTAYCISLQTQSTAFRLPNSRTWRRFSEFVWLRKTLDKVDNWKKPPVLPSRRFWNIMDPEFVETRQKQLEQWIHEVLSEPLYLSSTALHLFLQTEMTLEVIRDYLDGEMSEERMEEIWANQGKLYNYQPHNLLHNSVRQEPMEIHHSLEIPPHHSRQQREQDQEASLPPRRHSQGRPGSFHYPPVTLTGNP